jgi:predicted NBD/HSP70 family sugar kinase
MGIDVLIFKVLIFAACFGIVMNWKAIKAKADKGKKTIEQANRGDERAKKEIKAFHKNVRETLFNIFIKLPLFLIGLMICISIFALPFIYTGLVGGIVIWTCLLIIIKVFSKG